MTKMNGRRADGQAAARRSRLAQSIALVSLIAGLVAPLAAPATAEAAEPDGILISLDGITYSRAPQDGIFPSDVVLAPGSTVTGTLHVLNDSGQAGELRIAVSGTKAGTATFVESLSMRAVTRATADGAAVPLRLGESCSPLLTGELLGAGRSTEVTITLVMDPTVGNATQGSSADARLHVSLHQPSQTVPDAVADCPPGEGIPVSGDPGDPGDSGEEVPAEPSPDAGHSAGDRDTPSPALAPLETPAPSSPTADPAAPAVETPPTAGLPSTGSLSAGSSVDGALFPWCGVAALIAGAGAFVVHALRKRRVG